MQSYDSPPSLLNLPVWPVELPDGRGEGLGGWGGAKSYDSEKARSSINHSILSGYTAEIL
jgi:hypothetical protein